MGDIALLDGGLGQELIKRSASPPRQLWSLAVMMDEPHLVRDVHRDFIDAGARVLCLNTYTATPTRLARSSLDYGLDECQALAIRLAKEAVVEAGVEGVQIAGCLPPFVASYVADVAQNYEISLSEYRQIVAQEVDHVDLFLIETMSNIAEAMAALDAVGETNRPAYVCYTVEDDQTNRLRSGERLEEAVERARVKNPAGILVNCSQPEALTAAMPILAKSDCPFGGYANGFVSIDALRPGGTVSGLQARQDMIPDQYADHAMAWVDQGATIIGGCCEVGPAHIAHLRERLIGAGHQPGGLEL